MLSDLDKEIKKVLKDIFYEKILIIISFIIVIFGIIIVKNIYFKIGIFILIFVLIIISLFLIYKNYKEEKQIEQIVKILKNHNITSLDNIKELMNYNKERLKQWNFFVLAGLGLSIFGLIQDYVSIEENMRIVLIIEILLICYIVIRAHEDFSNQHYVSKLNDILFYLCINYDKYFKNNKSFLSKIIEKLINNT